MWSCDQSVFLSPECAIKCDAKTCLSRTRPCPPAAANMALASVAGTQPHAAYAAFVHGTRGKWSYLRRTVPHCGSLLQPIEDTLHESFIPAITGRPPCSQMKQKMLALPSKMGGLSLVDPTIAANEEYEASRRITSDLVQNIIHQEP